MPKLTKAQLAYLETKAAGRIPLAWGQGRAVRKRLIDAGLVEKTANGDYLITEAGHAALAAIKNPDAAEEE